MVDQDLVYPEGDWEIIHPARSGMKEGDLAALGLAMARPGSNNCAWIVVKNGRIAWEQYYGGSGPNDRHHLFSVTKSFISALIGIALADGALRSVDQTLAEFFPELPHDPSGLRAQLTLRHLLTMTSGFLWPLGGRARELMADRMRHSPDWTRFILELPIRGAEIGRFHYCSAATHLLSAILTRVTGSSACEYARDRLFAPIGIGPVQSGLDWETDPQGLSLGGWGLHLTAREVARFGWLYCCEGQWRGIPIIPAGWIQASTRLTGPAAGEYGYQWWLRQVEGELVFAGLGSGGQYLFCIPGRQMVVVILSRHVSHWPDRWSVLENLLASGLSN